MPIKADLFVRPGSTNLFFRLLGFALSRVVGVVLLVTIVLLLTGTLESRPNIHPAVNTDAAKTKQVILNLCKNAVEAMPEGGSLTIKSYRSGDMVVLEISDDDVGIPKGDNIFALLKTTKADGSGLGLGVVEQVVLAHSGTIDYTSQPGSGTTFKIVLPIEGASDV